MAGAAPSFRQLLNESMQPGELFILSAPSGTGKTTLIQSLMAGGLNGFGGLAFSVSHTTRKPRPGELDGKDYHFVDPATFQAMIAADAFLEWAQVHDNYYGTSLEEVFPRLEKGIDVVLDIDVQGAESVLARYPKAHGIFIMPPSYEDLERRLRSRGKDDAATIARRLAVSLSEMKRYDRYHYVIINDDARRASEVLAAIIIEKRHRRVRMQPRVQEILRDFQDQGSPSS
ncbi:MAG: guanylate kinase [Acidobacteriota bacterium]|jgi:guanylate kinase|nr:guanylate kinase [Acidobacteriota bacterium]